MPLLSPLLAFCNLFLKIGFAHKNSLAYRMFLQDTDEKEHRSCRMIFLYKPSSKEPRHDIEMGIFLAASQLWVHGKIFLSPWEEDAATLVYFKYKFELFWQMCLYCSRNWEAACSAVWKRRGWKKIPLVMIMTLLKRMCFQTHLPLRKQLQALKAFSWIAVGHCRRKVLNIRMLGDALALILVPRLCWSSTRIKAVSLCLPHYYSATVIILWGNYF